MNTSEIKTSYRSTVKGTEAARSAESESHAKRKTVIVLTGYYLPGVKGGGPIRSVSSLVNRLAADYEWRVVALDRDLGDSGPYAGLPSESGAGQVVEGTPVFYQKASIHGLYQMYRLLRAVDRTEVLYLNSFYSFRFSILPMWLCALRICRPRKVVLAPRGEFSAGAMALGRFKKRAYCTVVQALGIYDGVLWHASSEFEAEDIRREMCGRDRPNEKQQRHGGDEPKGVHVLAAGNLTGEVGGLGPERESKKGGKLKIVFVSRISPKKNLHFALRALRGVKGEIEVDIVGPVEDETYWKACQRERDQLGENVTVRVCGPADHASVRKRFQGSDLFLFPTLGENFGHVIAEALGSGCPVLLSDRTPWRELEKAGVGWDVPLETPEVFRELIQRCVDMDEEEHRAMRDAAFAYARKRLEDPAAIEANRRLFRVAFGEEAGVDSK